MPPLLADFTHARPCKPFCEKYLTLPGRTHGDLYRVRNHDIRKYRGLALARRGRRYAGTCDLLSVSVFGERAGENNDCWHSILNNGVIRS